MWPARREKLEKIRQLGINPYPSKFAKKQTVGQCREMFDIEVQTAGRLMSFRAHGSIVFADLADDSGKIQLLFHKDNLLELLDIGDFIGVSGKVVKTKAGEITIDVKKYQLLSKSLMPLPSEWFGLKDEELRYRQRYLDLILNPDLKELFRKKAIFWQSMREFLAEKGFLEVETPALETTAGGASANPFVTHHDALGMNLYLRISMGELWQKRLMVAGFEKTFEIGRQFRNEGLSREHLQDYTQMEFYWAYANYEDSMALVEELYKYVAKKTFGKLDFEINGHKVDLSKKWERINYVERIKKATGKDVSEMTDSAQIDQLWKSVRKDITGPAFLVGHPVAVSPLAKRMEKEPDFVERYQVLIAGSELGNGYSELNDPVDQSERFSKQQEARNKGDLEAQMEDADFVKALEYGMPPVTGFGVSERLFAFLANLPVREAVLFPLMRPE